MTTGSSNAVEFPRTHNEFRSDTFTVPTKEMLDLAHSSSAGDAVYDEDEDTIALEEKVAQLAGKEAGLFCVSGTLSNQIGMKLHVVEPPFGLLCDHRAHILNNEAAGIATLMQLMPTGVVPANGQYLVLEDLEEKVVPHNIHFAPTKMICLEDTIGGIKTPIHEIARISEFCKEKGIVFHCDGARLWNAAVADNVVISEICKYFDSVSLCLSKTIGAPIGSVLVGSKKFIAKLNHFRKQNGGGIRQSGMILRMASYAIDTNYGKLAKTHEMAKDFEKFLQENGIPILNSVDTNFVFIDMKKLKMDPKVLEVAGAKHNVKLIRGRIAFHYQNSEEAVENLKRAVLETYQVALKNKVGPSAQSIKY